MQKEEWTDMDQFLRFMYYIATELSVDVFSLVLLFEPSGDTKAGVFPF